MRPASTVLPSPTVVGDQQVDAGHPQRSQERLELVLLDPDAAVQGTRHRLAVERTFAVRVDVGHERGPARGAQQGVEVVGRHRRALADPRQPVRLQEFTARFEFPQEAFAVRRVVVLVLDLHKVQAAGVAAVRIVVRTDGRDDPAPVADPGEHADPGDVGACLCLLHALSCWRGPRAPPIGGDVSDVKLC